MGERGNLAGGFALFRQRDQEISFDPGRNFFVGEPFNGLADLFVRERVRYGELFDELFQHGLILRIGTAGSKRKVWAPKPARFDESVDSCAKMRNLSGAGTVSTRSSE